MAQQVHSVVGIGEDNICLTASIDQDAMYHACGDVGLDDHGVSVGVVHEPQVFVIEGYGDVRPFFLNVSAIHSDMIYPPHIFCVLLLIVDWLRRAPGDG